ncbi:MAG: F0F1 ATP synthase subunit B' [Paracoccus sp. (in: a-proteobacteria)]|uniref:F0F1 ATP synthase subunit B' n=1 Tax=Paracoccus sp. TaxID=267 RepID=UPI0026DF1C37|nr:F0F1 ATP synthase subunit B' [Paracoccus sp. (in: a-proteobacteria)]MDO5630462.1 F0F1 ATP synthase subunit B' [Paracoccus sp. (in: a-proteobacteria)]
MISLLQQTAPVVVEETIEIITVEPDVIGVAGDVAHHGADVTHEVASTGLPQLDVSTFPNQIFWLVITLGVIYWILSRIALPRIAAVLSDRQGAITGDLMAAEEFKRKAQEAEAAYDKALADARAEAQKIVAANRAEIQAELDAAIAHADAEIAARASESERRIGEIRASAAADAETVARDVTADLLRAFGGAADQSAIDAAVDRRLKGAVQ